MTSISNHYTEKTIAVPLKKREAWYCRLWKQIQQVAKRIFCWLLQRNPDGDAPKKLRVRPFPPNTSTPKKIIKTKAVPQETAKTHCSPVKPLLKRNYDASLQSLEEFVKSFSATLTDLLYEEKIKPIINILKNDSPEPVSKIHLLHELLKDSFPANFESLIHRMVEINAANITDRIFQRIADFILKIPFEKRFDQIVLREFGDHIKLAYSGEPLTRMCKKEKQLQYQHLAQRLNEILFPPNAKGQSSSYDEIWQNLYVPEEIQELITKIEQQLHPLLNETTAQIYADIKKPFQKVMHGMFIGAAHDIIQKTLINTLTASFEELFDPDKFNNLSATYILPALNELLVQMFLYTKLFESHQELAPLFFKLIHAEKKSIKDLVLVEIEEHLIRSVKKSFLSQECVEYYPKDRWKSLTQDVVESAQKEIKHRLHAKQIPIPLATQQDVATALQAYSCEQPQENKDEYGKLAIDVIFKLGQWKAEGWIKPFIETPISLALTYHLGYIKQDHRLLIGSLANALKRNFLDRDWLKTKLFVQEISQSKPSSENRVKEQLKTTSQLIHDLVQNYASSHYFFKREAIKWFLHTQLPMHTLVSNVYNKIVGDPARLEKLVFKVAASLLEKPNAA